MRHRIANEISPSNANFAQRSNLTQRQKQKVVKSSLREAREEVGDSVTVTSFDYKVDQIKPIGKSSKIWKKYTRLHTCRSPDLM